MFILIFIVIAQFAQELNAQLNLGSFNLNHNPLGDLLLGFGQGGNLFGFGGDRFFQVTIGPGKFETQSNNGLQLGGKRAGVNNHFALHEGQGLNLGSIFNAGNIHDLNGKDPISQLSSFVQNIGSLFKPHGNEGILGITSPNQFTKIVSSKKSVNSGEHSSEESGGDQFPLGVGKGWDGDEIEITTILPLPTLINFSTDEFELKKNFSEEILPPKRSRITTEGKRHNGKNALKEEDLNKNDGETGEFAKTGLGKLPIPEGLEMISTGEKARKH